MCDWIIPIISIIAIAAIAITFILVTRPRRSEFEVVMVNSGLATGDRVTLKEIH